jgi:hypothetical protein
MNDLLAFIKDNYTLLALISIIVFVGNEVWSNYKEHKRIVFGELAKRLEKTDCGTRMDNHLKESHHD